MTFVVCAALALSTVGCVGGAWQHALETDTASGYHQFLRDHPGSPYTADAEERIAFHRVMLRPSLAGYEGFREAHPNSKLVGVMRPAVEDLAFDAARRAGTAAAYEQFEEQFPGGPHTFRAEGNAAYLTGVRRVSGDRAVLQAFAERYPDSDFTVEALRTIGALETRDRTRFRTIRLLVEVSAATPEAARVHKALVERAMKIYQHTGISLVPVRRGDAVPDNAVTLRVRHREEAESAHVEGGDVSRSGWMARTKVTLRRGAESTPIWHREFVVRVPPHEVIPNASALFSSKQAPLYWDGFFVPIASWNSSAAVRSPVQAGRSVAAVDALDGRAVVLFEDGGFEFIDLADPENPLVVSRHERPTKLEHFEGVRIHDGRVLLWGQDGLEIVGFDAGGTNTLVSRPRGEVGSIAALSPVPGGLLLASSRGLLLTDADGANPKRVMRRAVLGLDESQSSLVFADGESVYVTTLDLLRSGRVIAQFRIGRTFEPARVRVEGDVAVVMGEGGALLFHLPKGGKPRMVSRFERRDVGEIRDALRVDGRVYLVGSNGLQLLDRSLRRVVESVDVVARKRLAATGRHLVVVGGRHVQVVDALPFSSGASVPARPASGKPASSR